jgi:hypothetical protein
MDAESHLGRSLRSGHGYSGEWQDQLILRGEF